MYDWCVVKKINLCVSYTLSCMTDVGTSSFLCSVCWTEMVGWISIGWLPPSLFETWMGVVDETFSYSFENQNDKVSWKWGSKRVCLLNRCMITWHCAQGVLNSLIFWRLTFPIKSNFHLVGRKWGCADQRYHGQEEVVRWPYLCLLWSTWNSWPPPFSLACGKMCLGNDWFMFWGI